MPAVQGTLRERPLPRLVQQLFRKKLTGRLAITDQTGDQSDVFMRDGLLVHVGRPVDTDRLDNLLVEFGLVSPEIVARATQQIAPGMRLGEVLDRMGVLDKVKLAQVLKSQVLRKLTRLFFVADGRYAVYLEAHSYGQGADLPLMRVDPRTVIYPGIRAAYDLPRVTQELTRLLGQRFRLGTLSPGFIAAIGVPPNDSTIEWLRKDWLTLDALDSITARPLEVRSIVLALYYCDLLEREPIGEAPSDSAVPRATHAGDSGYSMRLSGERSAPHFVAPPPTTPAPPTAPMATSQPASPPAPPSAYSLPKPTLPHASPVASSRPVLTSPVVRPTVPGPALESKPAAPAASASRPSPAGNEALRSAIQEMAQKLDHLSHFEALGVSQHASSGEVSIAFVRAARQYHPDRLTSVGLQDLRPVAERILARINEASMVLSDPTRRAEYLASLSGGPTTSASLPTVLEAENWFLKGEVFLKKGDHAKAIECFTMATQGNPSEPQYRGYLAWTRFDDPKARKETVVRDSLKVIEGVIQERPRFARGHFWAGLLWKFLGDIPKAEQAFRQAVVVDNSFIDASRELRLIEMRKTKSSSKAPTKPEPPRGGLMGKLFNK